MSDEINTRNVSERRKLRFASIDDALAEAERLVACEAAGRIECLGNWNLGQILGHLATWAEYAYKPNPMPAPWFVKLFVKLFRNRIINDEMRPGARLPRIPGGTLGTEECDTASAMQRYRAAMERLRREAPTHPSPAFGPLTHEEGIKLNLRHSELHLGFVRERP